MEHSNAAAASRALGFCLGSLVAGLRQILLPFFGMEMIMTMKYQFNQTGSFLKNLLPQECKEDLRLGEDRRFVAPNGRQNSKLLEEGIKMYLHGTW